MTGHHTDSVDVEEKRTHFLSLSLWHQRSAQPLICNKIEFNRNEMPRRRRLAIREF